MSREIDLTKELSAEDRQYLVDRDRWRALATADGHDDPERAKRDAVAANELTQTRRPPTVVTHEAVVEEANQQQAAAQENADPLADKPYEEWPYSALQEELKARLQEALDAGMAEADARERYKAGGKQADLAQRLTDDDAVSAD